MYQWWDDMKGRGWQDVPNNSAPSPLCPLQITHYMPWDWTGSPRWETEF